MKKSVFNPQWQQEDVSSKIVAGLERVSEVFKVLLWEKAKLVGLSPIQMQILIFVAFHKNDLCNVSHLAKEFNVSKPTISDAVKILDKKKLIEKFYSSADSRSYAIALSSEGNKKMAEIHDFSNILKQQIDSFATSDVEDLFGILSKLIYKLNQNGVLSVQRTCYGCKFYKKDEAYAYCNLLKMELSRKEIRLDCPEFELR